MPHWRLFYHLVWATRGRYPLLGAPEAVRLVEHSLAATCAELNVMVHAIGVMPEHVHLACSIPPSLAIAEVVKRLKGASSHRLNQTVFALDLADFGWQAEYGVYSYTERVLPDVIAYVRNQESRHTVGRLWTSFEQTGSLGTTKADAQRGN